MLVSAAHIAGITVSDGSQTSLDGLAISAGTRALLDAGVTYSDVDLSVAGCMGDARIPRALFDTFGREGAPVIEVDNSSALFTAIQSIRSGQAKCTLIIGLDRDASDRSDGAKTTAVGVVIVSDLFLTARAYLKDSAVRILAHSLASRALSQVSGGPNHFRTLRYTVQSALRQAGLEAKDVGVIQVQQSSNVDVQQMLGDVQITRSPSSSQSPMALASETGLAGLTELVYQLRGWAHDRPLPGLKNSLQLTSTQDALMSVTLLARSDGRPAPAWSVVKDVREGRERLGYNPAIELREITKEDLEAVRARRGYNSDSVVKQLQLPVKGGDRASLSRL